MTESLLPLGAGTPAQAVLRFVDEVLSTPTPEAASRLLGSPLGDNNSEGHLLRLLFDTLSTSRFAIDQPEAYCDTLHTVCLTTCHPFYATNLERLIDESGSFCQDLFRATVRANDVAEILYGEKVGEKITRYRADVYSILAECLKYVRGESDAHVNLLLEIFGSFFPGRPRSAMRMDFERAQRRLYTDTLSEEESNQMNRLFASMAIFVKRSFIDHWSILTNYNPQALGIVTTLGSNALQMLSWAFQRHDCQQLSEGLCYMVRMIFEKLHNELSTVRRYLEEVLRDSDIVKKCYSLMEFMDRRMNLMLRTHAFGMFRGVLLLVLDVPQESRFRTGVCQFIEERTELTTSILSTHLDVHPDASELQVLLFELVSIHYEIDRVTAELPKIDAFVDAVQSILPNLTRRLVTEPVPNAKDIALANAQIIFLSKVCTPRPIPPQRQDIQNTSFMAKVMTILKDSRFFMILLKKWPPEGDQEIQHHRSLQPTARLGLHLVMAILDRHQNDTAVQECVYHIFANCLEEFQTALKMGSHRMIANREWIPHASDEEIAQLIEGVVQSSDLIHRSELWEHIQPYCRRIQRRL